MASENLQLVVVTPMGTKLEETVTEVTATGDLGEMGILPAHIPILTVLDIGRMRFLDAAGKARSLALNGGFLEVEDDKVIVLTQTAEFASEIDVDRARAAKERAEAALADLEFGQAKFLQKARSLRRAEVRLAVASGQ